MWEINLSESKKEFAINISVMFLLFVSGLIFAITYFFLDQIHTSFLSVDCLIPNNVLFSTCQEWFSTALFPILELKSVLIFANYFAIFGIVFGLFYMGFKTKKHPVLLVTHIVSSIILGYLSIEIGNIYRVLIQNQNLYNILVPFAIYNKIMLYFPQFMFFVIFFSGLLGFMGIFRSKGQFNQGNEDLG